MKFKAALNRFLTNKLVLNIISLIALICVISYIIMGNFNALIYFIVFAVLIRFFSKNMIIVLGVPIILVTLLTYKRVISEGLENNKDSKKPAKKNNSTEKKNKDEGMENLEYGEFKNDKKSNKQDSKTSQGLSKTPIITPDDDSTTTTSAVASTDAVASSDESFEVGRGKRRQGSQIDYAATVEDAYDELNKILGSDGVKRLTDDTQRLMKQQMQLAESMKSMGPLIQGMGPMLESAKSMLSGLGNNKEDFASILKLTDKFKETQG
jgi:uncharacterized membrane protein